MVPGRVAAEEVAPMSDHAAGPSGTAERTEKGTKEKIIIKIANYLTKVGAIGDPEALALLREAGDALKNTEATKTTTNDSTTVCDAISEIRTSLRLMEEKIDQSTKPRSDAAAAAYAPPSAQEARAKGPRNDPRAPAINRRARDITIEVTDAGEKERIDNMTNERLVESLRAEGASGILGVARMPNGKIRIQMESIEQKEALQARQDWTHRIAPSAAVQQRTFSVRVHGVRVSHIDTLRQREAIAYLTASNARLHPGLIIKKPARSNKVARHNKTVSTLHVEVTTPEAANRLISEGLLEDHEVKDCERSIRGCTVTQCFRCHRYGHVGRYCKNKIACGRCAEDHATDDCMADRTKPQRCVVCKEDRHPAWSTNCRVRQEERIRAESKMQNRAPFYATNSVPAPARTKDTTPPPEPTRFRTNTVESGDSSSSPSRTASTAATDRTDSIGNVSTTAVPYFAPGYAFTSAHGKKGKATSKQRHVEDDDNETGQATGREPDADTPRKAWDGMEIMKPGNMKQALGKRPVGRPRGSLATTSGQKRTMIDVDHESGEL